MYGITPITCLRGLSPIAALPTLHRTSPRSVAISPTQVPWRINTGRAEGEEESDAQDNGECGWAASVLVFLCCWAQAGCLLDPGHGWLLSSLLPVFCFAGGIHGRIKCRRLHRQFVTGRNRTKLCSSKTSSDGAG